MEHYPLLSNWMRNLYCLFLDREDIKQGLKTILQAADYVKSGISVCIFPEGTRNKNADETEMLPFHDGSFKIAARAKSPIIPIAISNSANIWEANFPKMTPTHVVIEYGKPIIPSELDRDTQRRLGSYTQDIIKEMLIKTKNWCEHQKTISMSVFRHKIWFFIYCVPAPRIFSAFSMRSFVGGLIPFSG